jgi:hypothetical protein
MYAVYPACASGSSNYPEAAPLVLQSLNIERLPEGAYRPPTDAERAAFAQATQGRKAQAKATRPKAPQLTNPADADAQRLQDLWNAKAKAAHDEARAEGRRYGDYTPTAVRRITQAQYSATSGGAYSRCEPVVVCENGHRPQRWHDYGSALAPQVPVAFKVRKTYGGGGFTAQADAVIVLTDKAAKAPPARLGGARRPVRNCRARLTFTPAPPTVRRGFSRPDHEQRLPPNRPAPAEALARSDGGEGGRDGRRAGAL